MPELTKVELLVDGTAFEAGRLEAHYQENPFPGGHTYQLTIWDRQSLDLLVKDYPPGEYRNLSVAQMHALLNLFRGFVSWLIRREQPVYWANTVEVLIVALDRATIRGICSEHQRQMNG